MNKKKDFPLPILNALAPFVGKHDDLYYVELKDSENLMQAFDIDDSSDFHFFITGYKKTTGNTGNGYGVYIEYKPASYLTNEVTTNFIDTSNLSTFFKNWVSLLEQYNKVVSFYDDPILKAREEEYFTEFEEVIPEEEKEKPFKTSEILQLDKIFDQLKIELTKQINQENTESVVNELENIKEEISVLQENIHITTKGKVFKKMASFYARLAKLGLPYIKKFGEEFQKEAFKKIISFGLSKASDIIDLI